MLGRLVGMSDNDPVGDDAVRWPGLPVYLFCLCSLAVAPSRRVVFFVPLQPLLPRQLCSFCVPLQVPCSNLLDLLLCIYSSSELSVYCLDAARSSLEHSCGFFSMFF